MLVAGAIGLVACSFLAMRPLAVEVAERKAAVTVQLFGLGTVEARILSEVGFEAGATLVKLNADQETILTSSVVQRARQQIGLFTSLPLVVSAVIIALIPYTMTMDKMREIATLKLTGAPNRTIVGLILQQTLAMVIVGFGLGAALNVSIKDYFPRRVLLRPDDGLELGAVVILICVLSNALGVRLALKADPATAQGG